MDPLTPPTPLTRRATIRRREPPFQRRRIAEQDLVYEIDRAARAIADARGLGGQRVFRTDRIWRVLSTVASSDC